MKKKFFLLFLVAIAVPTFLELNAENEEKQLESLVQEVVPKGVDIAQHPDAKNELLFHLKTCGAGVVEGSGRANRCSYQIKIDEFFLKPLNEKTGFIYDENWPYQKGVIWATASPKEMAAVPTKWDVDDHGEMIRIVKQKCGDCWAQATRANVEQLILTHTGVNVPLSTQTLISSCCGTGSCRGGYMTTPGWVVDNGLVTLERDPYKGSNSSCKFNLNSVNWDYHLMQAPYVGSSLNYSRAINPKDRAGSKVRNTQALMTKHRSSAVVTIAAISSSGGIIKNCSSINSGGNHMQDVVGWYEDGGEVIARVQNSWGTSHGQNGYTHMRWDCGDNKLNRGLGKSARVGIYNMPLECKALADPYVGPNSIMFFKRNTKGIQLGRAPKFKQKCSWLPKEGLSNPNSCAPFANPAISTEYHLTTETDCGKASAMVLVRPLEEKGKVGPFEIATPHGKIKWSE